MNILNRKISIPDHHVFLFGPRGTGKSTYLLNSIKNPLYIDLLQPDKFRNYSAAPERLIETVDAHPEKKTVIIDEIQRIPELLHVIHILIERKDNRRYIMTGSSARKLRKQGTNLLAGRAYTVMMRPFTATELGAAFNIEESLRYGMIPVIYASRIMMDI